MGLRGVGRVCYNLCPNMVPVAQWQSASLWMKMLRVRTPSGTQGTLQGVLFV